MVEIQHFTLDPNKPLLGICTTNPTMFSIDMFRFVETIKRDFNWILHSDYTKVGIFGHVLDLDKFNRLLNIIEGDVQVTDEELYTVVDGWFPRLNNNLLVLKIMTFVKYLNEKNRLRHV